MPLDRERKVAPIFVAGCASRSLAKTMRLKYAPEELHLRASELRRIDPTAWKEFRKIVVLRPTILRYQAAVEWCKAECEDAELQRIAKTAKPHDFLDHISSIPLAQLPLRFRPQTWWLDSAIDDFIPLDKLAAWCNHNRLQNLCFEGGTPHTSVVTLPSSLKPLLANLYAQDETLFAKLRTWNPNKKIYDTLYGVCKSCTAAIRIRD